MSDILADEIQNEKVSTRQKLVSKSDFQTIFLLEPVKKLRKNNIYS